jgi:hypothetical protein
LLLVNDIIVDDVRRNQDGDAQGERMNLLARAVFWERIKIV